MGKIDMNKVGKTTGNSAEIKKSDEVKPAEAPIESAESIDNVNAGHEDTSEIKQETEQNNENAEANAEDSTKKSDEVKPEKGTVIVRYVGGGAWIDNKGCYWANEKKSENILNERQYSVEEYESRDDIKFMVAYGAMKSTVVGK